MVARALAVLVVLIGLSSSVLAADCPGGLSFFLLDGEQWGNGFNTQVDYPAGTTSVSWYAEYTLEASWGATVTTRPSGSGRIFTATAFEDWGHFGFTCGGTDGSLFFPSRATLNGGAECTISGSGNDDGGNDDGGNDDGGNDGTDVPLGPAPQTGPVATHGRLSIANGRVVGESGESVQLFGMSLFWGNWEPEWWTAGVVDWLADDFNTNCIRAPMSVEDGVGSEAGYLTLPDVNEARMRTIVNAAIAKGMYVVIDWHSHHAHNHEDEAIEFFQKMARSYGDYPNVIYEIFNEPLNTVTWSEIKPYMQAVINAIREIDSDNLIVVGSPNWSQDVHIATADPVSDPVNNQYNIAYVLHFYACTHGAWLRDYAETALSRGYAIFISEYGTTIADGGSDGAICESETNAWFSWATNLGISYLNWSVADKNEGSAILKPYGPTSNYNGNWAIDDLTASGQYIRSHYRSKATQWPNGNGPSGPDGWTCSASDYGNGGDCDCDCGIEDPDCVRPSVTDLDVFTRDNPDILRVRFQKNDAPATTCWEVRIKLKNTSKWKTLSWCTTKRYLTYKRSKIEAMFPDMPAWGDAQFKVGVRSKDQKHATVATCGKLFGKERKKVTYHK